LARLRITSHHLVGGGEVTLTVRRVAAGIEIAWPKSVANPILESSASVEGPWTAVNVTPVTAGEQTVVTLPMVGGATYFRLRL
jgi:hypothetical protein